MEVNIFVAMCLWALNFGAGEHIQKGLVPLPQSLDCDFRLIWYEEQKIFVFIKVKITRKRVFMRSFMVDFQVLMLFIWYFLVFSTATQSICSSWEFRCDNGQCIYYGYECDGRRQCYDGSDEWYCGMYNYDYNIRWPNIRFPIVVLL